MPGPRTKPNELAYYEGLARKTASMYAGIVEEDYEDLCQIFRVKAWRALKSYDPTRSKLPVERYVFSCIRNQVKDLLKRKRRDLLFIEDVAPPAENEGITRDRFDSQYLCADPEQVYGAIEDGVPLIPSTLTEGERNVVALLYLDFKQAEIAMRLGMTKREVGIAVKRIKEKMADWHPSNGSRHLAPSPEAHSPDQLAA